MKQAKNLLLASILLGVLIVLATFSISEANSDNVLTSYQKKASVSMVDFKVTTPGTSAFPSSTQTPTPTDSATANPTNQAQPTFDSFLTNNAGVIVTVGGILTLVAVYLVASRLKKEA